jgi:hypothetical protein
MLKTTRQVELPDSCWAYLEKESKLKELPVDQVIKHAISFYQARYLAGEIPRLSLLNPDVKD